jgi:type II secretion system protein N
MHPVFLRRRWLLPTLGLAAIALFIFVVTLRAFFPYPELARAMEARLRTQGLEAKFLGVGPYGAAGVRAQSLQLGPVGSPERRTEFLSPKAHFSLGGLLRMKLGVDLVANACGGTLEAFVPLTGPRLVQARWTGVDLRRLPLSADLAALGLRGRANGKVEANLGALQQPGLAGTLELTIEDAKLGPGSMAGMPLPGVSLGNGQLHLIARDGRLELEALKFDGGNLDVRLTGAMSLREPFPTNPVEGVLSLRPDNKALRDLGLLFAFFPGSRTPDGTYTARVGGSLGSLVLSQLPATR